MNECIDSLESTEAFSTMDANNGYWKIKLYKTDMNKTAFVNHSGFYPYTSMPSWLENAPAKFQRAMDIILAPVKWQHTLVYLHNVVLSSKSHEEHLRHVKSVLQLIQKYGMTLNLKKCFIFHDAVDYLGHVIAPRRLHIATKTIDSVHYLKYPTTTSER